MGGGLAARDGGRDGCAQVDHEQVKWLLQAEIKLQFQDRTVETERHRCLHRRAGMIRLPQRHMHGRLVMDLAVEDGKPAHYHQIVPVARGRGIRPCRGGRVKRLVGCPGEERVERQELPFGFAGKFLRIDLLQAEDVGLQFQKFRTQRRDPLFQPLRSELVVAEGFDVERGQPDQGFLPQGNGFRFSGHSP